jgi:hypothetical protein
MRMTDDQIKHMVSRFLTWSLPADFHPDNGVSFTAVSNPGSDYPFRHNPVGTNLFTAVQAEAMIRHMLDGLPEPRSEVMGVPTDGSYYLDGKTIKRSPIHTKNDDGGTTITMGFPVCTLSEWIGPEGDEAILNLFNRELRE